MKTTFTRTQEIDEPRHEELRSHGCLLNLLVEQVWYQTEICTFCIQVVK